MTVRGRYVNLCIAITMLRSQLCTDGYSERGQPLKGCGRGWRSLRIVTAPAGIEATRPVPDTGESWHRAPPADRALWLRYCLNASTYGPIGPSAKPSMSVRWERRTMPMVISRSGTTTASTDENYVQILTRPPCQSCAMLRSAPSATDHLCIVAT